MDFKDFQRDIRKQDKFQIMYEIYLNEKKEIVETEKFFMQI